VTNGLSPPLFGARRTIANRSEWQIGPNPALHFTFGTRQATATLQPGVALDGSLEVVREICAEAIAKNDLAMLVRVARASLANA
jgi:hypothetical protein